MHWSQQTTFSNHTRLTLHMDITKWSLKSIDYILCSWICRSCIQSSKTRPGDDCGSDHELPKLQNSDLNWKCRKITRLFRYDIRQIPHDYTVEVSKRFKGLDLTERVPEELWTEVHDIVQEVVTKTIPKKMKYKKAQWLSEALSNSWEKERSERQKRKGKIYPSECRVPKYNKER